MQLPNDGTGHGLEKSRLHAEAERESNGETMTTLERIEQYQAPLLADLERLVNMDSFSKDKADVDRVGAELRRLLTDIGCAVELNRSNEYGDSFIASLEGSGTVKILM